MKRTILPMVLLLLASTAFCQFYSVTTGTNETIKKVISVDENIMLLVGNNNLIMRSTDKGESWQKINYPLSEDINDITLSPTGMLYIPSYERIHISRDSGLSWSEYRYHKNLDTITGLFTPTDKVMYSFNSSYDKVYKITRIEIFRTEDSGKYWTPSGTSLSEEIIYDMSYLNNDSVCLVSKGKFIKTRTGFKNNFPDLEAEHHYLPFTLNAVFVYNEVRAYALNDKSLIIKISDPFKSKKSITWDSLIFNSQVHLNELLFINQDTGFIVGDSGLIIRTFDGGVSWVKLNSGVTEKLINLAVINTGEIFAYGENGVLLKTTNWGGIGDTLLSIKKHEHNNFSVTIIPNPFNEKVTVQFCSGIGSVASLQITDIHNRILFSKQMYPLGDRIFEWNASSLAAGIYLLQIYDNNGSIQTFKLLKK